MRLTPTERAAIRERTTGRWALNGDVTDLLWAAQADCARLLSDLDAADAECERLLALLTEAINEWEYNASYKSEYFQQKHGDASAIAEMRAQLKAAMPQGDGT